MKKRLGILGSVGHAVMSAAGAVFAAPADLAFMPKHKKKFRAGKKNGGTKSGAAALKREKVKSKNKAKNPKASR